MTVKIREDSIFQFADPYFDEEQGEYVWGIADPPDPVLREDDQFYTIREDDRFDLIAHRLLGSSRWFWVILHYNSIPWAADVNKYIDKEIRLPSRQTIEKFYRNARSEPVNN